MSGTIGGAQRPPPRGRVPHPAVLAERDRRAADLQLRLADAITAFAGSMRVYAHVIAFAVWISEPTRR